MSSPVVPEDVLARLAAHPRRPGDSSPLTDDEREVVALSLEQLAARVRAEPVREVSLDVDFDYDFSHDRSATSGITVTFGP